jgi:hypothetical protein
MGIGIGIGMCAGGTYICRFGNWTRRDERMGTEIEEGKARQARLGKLV